MPIYEYQCTGCHHHFDLIQKINEAPITLCPNCSENKLMKLISAAGFQLKGTGWYATDFKNKGAPIKTDAEKKEQSSTKAESASPANASKTSTKGDAD